MPKCAQYPRVCVENWEAPLNPETHAWISIQEEDCMTREGKIEHYPHIKNEVLDTLPNLKLKFSDLQKPVTHWHGHMLFPPSEKDAFHIVRFCVRNRGKNFIVNCAAGISRSGAICQFLEECMGYVWIEEVKKYAAPSPLLFKLLKEEYLKMGCEVVPRTTLRTAAEIALDKYKEKG